MSDVEQYEPGLEDKGNPKMYEMGAQGGRWVLASAFDALKAQLDEALRVLRRMVNSVERCKDLSVLDDEMREHASDARAVLKERP